LHRIWENAGNSFTACKAALNVFHQAVRHIRDPDDDVDLPEDNKTATNRGGWSRSKREREKFVINDEAIFSEIIEWSVANLLKVLVHHGGTLQETSGKGKKNKWAKDKADKPGVVAGLVDPTRYSKWKRMQTITKMFWQETYTILHEAKAMKMQEYVLRYCSTPEALSWIWPFPNIRFAFFRKCCNLWGHAKSQSVRLLAFLFLRNYGAMTLQVPGERKTKGLVQLEAITKKLLQQFAQVAAQGYSWQSHNAVTFMENCFVELLRMDDGAAYRLGYACIRQLALTLRNATVAASHGATVGEKEQKSKPKMSQGRGTEKQSKRRIEEKQAVQQVVAWPFVRAAYLWTKAVGAIPALRPLAYPLSMIIMGAAKGNLTKLPNFPFVYHCLLCQNRLAVSLEAFVPVGSHLLRLLDMLLQAMDKLYKKRGAGPGKTGDSVLNTKAAELEVLLRLNEQQVKDTLTLEAVGSAVCFLLTDHMGLLSQSPSFPELIVPVLMHIKRHSKHCRSEPLRRQLKAFITNAEATADDLRNRREALQQAPLFSKFLLFNPDTALAKTRVTMLQRKAAEDKTRIDAEMQDNNANQHGKKRKRADDEQSSGNKKGQTNSSKKNKKKKPKKLGESGPKEDTVEEMDFSSGED